MSLTRLPGPRGGGSVASAETFPQGLLRLQSNCFFFRKVCRATLQKGADPDDCSRLSRRPKACRADGCQFAGRGKNRSCAAPAAAASSKP